MKKTVGKYALIILINLCSTMFAIAQRAYLDIDEKVNKYPKVEWLKGVPVTDFDKDRIYVIELWATWCKPCVASMPHMSRLNTKFKDKITFVGQNIWDEDFEKVKSFLAKNESLMNYSIAYARGNKGETDFDKNWTKPSGTVGIPRTFIVQNNTLIWMTDPFHLSEAILQLVVDKKFTVEAAEKLAVIAAAEYK